MHELALFAGAGGGLLASKLLGWRSVCYVEIDNYCVEVLKARIKDGYLDDAPIWDDVRTFYGRPWSGCVDIVTAGFPCQPFSGAGSRLGAADERNLWPDTIRIIREVKPEWVLLENVSIILSNPYIGSIFANLAESGFDFGWSCLSAFEVGAPHIRERVWIVAHANSRGLQESAYFSQGKLWRNVDKCNLERVSWWKTEPGVGRVVDGLAHRVDRIRAIGNGQVPAVARAAWNIMTCS